MPRGLTILAAGCVGLAILPLACQRSSNEETSDERSPPPITKVDLKLIAFTYVVFCDKHIRPPANLEELAPFVVTTVIPESHRQREEELLLKLREGEYVVVWNQRAKSDSVNRGDILIAHERQTAETGGFVVFADLRVKWMSPAELERALRREK